MKVIYAQCRQLGPDEWEADFSASLPGAKPVVAPTFDAAVAGAREGAERLIFQCVHDLINPETGRRVDANEAHQLEVAWRETRFETRGPAGYHPGYEPAR